MPVLQTHDEGSTLDAILDAIERRCERHSVHYRREGPADVPRLNPACGSAHDAADSSDDDTGSDESSRSTRARRCVVGYTADHPEPLTLFHSAVVPSIGLRGVFDAISRAPRVPVDVTTGLIAAVLLDRYERRSGLPVTELMMHRLYIACLLVAAKAHQDLVPSSTRLSRAAGIARTEMDVLELALLSALDWHAVARESDIAALAEGLGGATPLRGADAATGSDEDSEPVHCWRASQADSDSRSKSTDAKATTASSTAGSSFTHVADAVAATVSPSLPSTPEQLQQGG